MTRLAIATLVGIAGLTLGTYADAGPVRVVSSMIIGFATLGIYIWLDLRSRDLPPATRRELAAAHKRNRLDLSGALRRNERAN